MNRKRSKESKRETTFSVHGGKVHGLKMSAVHVTSCNENSWRGCRRVHRGGRGEGEGAGSEGGMSSASHLDCQTPGARLGIFQREAAATLPARRRLSPPVSVCPAAPPACICAPRSLSSRQTVAVRVCVCACWRARVTVCAC